MSKRSVKKHWFFFPGYRMQESKSSLTRIDIANAVRPVLAMYPRLASLLAVHQGLAKACSSIQRRQRRSARYFSSPQYANGEADTARARGR